LDEASQQAGGEVACEGFKSNFVLKGQQAGAEAREAPCAISAHFGLSPVGIKITHFEICSACRWKFCSDESIGTDAPVAVAQAGDLRLFVSETAATIV
jgi:hypothetical protein